MSIRKLDFHFANDIVLESNLSVGCLERSHLGSLWLVRP